MLVVKVIKGTVVARVRSKEDIAIGARKFKVARKPWNTCLDAPGLLPAFIQTEISGQTRVKNVQ